MLRTAVPISKNSHVFSFKKDPIDMKNKISQVAIVVQNKRQATHLHC